MVKPPGKCAFCGGFGMTKQHIFGKRLLTLLDGQFGTHLIIEQLPETERTIRTRSGNVWSKQLRRVCNNCNAGWMRLLEEKSYPVLKPLICGSTKIAVEDQRILAARIAHMVMVASLSVSVDLYAVSQQERDCLRLTGEPPPYWLILLARGDVPVELGQFYSSDAFRGQLSKADGSTEIVKNLVVTFLLGRLCIQVLTRVPHMFQGYTGTRLAQLWPLPNQDIQDIDLLQTSLLTQTQIALIAKAIREEGIRRKV